MKYLTKKFSTILITILCVIAISAKAADTPNSLPTVPTDISRADLQKLLNAIADIKHYYVQPVDTKQLTDDAIRGMVSGLDPHSAYLTAEDLKELNAIATGQFDGIGVTVIPETDALRVISPVDGSPAQKAGIKAGDLIVKINDQLIKDLDPEKAIILMRGKKGSKVTVYVVRKQEAKILKFELVRNTIKIPTITTKLYDNHYGYIRVAIFQENTPRLLTNAIKELENQTHKKLYGLIVDVRNNPGGLLDSAVNASEIFLDAKHLQDNNLVTYIIGFDNKREDFRIKPNELLQNIPVILLINEGSASGAEILAGALQDHKRATIVGTRSFGKGSVQTVIPLDNSSALKLTTALYYTPSGRSIQAKGIDPDVAVNPVQLNKTKTNGSGISPLHEKDLQNHLQNGDNTSNVESTSEKTNALIYNDFQLYTALNILKAQAAGEKPNS